MKLFKNRSRLMWLLLLSTLLTIGYQAQAQEEEGDDDDAEETDWRAERERIKDAIAKSVQKRLDKEVTKESVVVQLQKQIPQLAPWTYPVNAPKLTKEEIRDELVREINDEIKVKFPETEREKFAKEAEEKYKLWKRNDNVSFIIRGGQGTDTHVVGKLMEVTAERVKVYPRRTINIRDLNDETKARLYPEYHEVVVKEYIAGENRRYDTKIEGYRMDETEKRLPGAFYKNGYIPNISTLIEDGKLDKRKLKLRMESPNADHWIARSEVVEASYQQARELLKEQLSQEEEARQFRAKGYVNVPKKKFKKLMDSGAGDDLFGWMPRDEEKRLMQEQKQLIDEERANAGGNDGMGGPEGMPGEMPH